MPCFPYSLEPEYIDVSLLPEIRMKLSVKGSHGYINTLDEKSFSFMMDNSPVSIKSFTKSTYPEHRFYSLFIFDEGRDMKGTPLAASKRISERILSSLSNEDIAAFVGINSTGRNILDFTPDKSAVMQNISNITPSRYSNPDISGEILRRIGVFERQIRDKGLKGAVFIFSNTVSLDYNMSYDISKKYPFAYIFCFSPFEGTGQITSENFFLNPAYNINISNTLNSILEYRPCFYIYEAKTAFDTADKQHRLSISLDLLPQDSFSYYFGPEDRSFNAPPPGLKEAFRLNRLLMYLSLLTGLNIFFFFIARLLKKLPSRSHRAKFYIRFLYGQIIISLLAGVISILY